MSSILQSNQYADFGGVADARKEAKKVREQQLKQQRDTEMKEAETGTSGARISLSTRQK
jgi:hypothetical protein